VHIPITELPSTSLHFLKVPPPPNGTLGLRPRPPMHETLQNSQDPNYSR
jgi:hypothetical protein